MTTLSHESKLVNSHKKLTRLTLRLNPCAAPTKHFGGALEVVASFSGRNTFLLFRFSPSFEKTANKNATSR